MVMWVSPAPLMKLGEEDTGCYLAQCSRSMSHHLQVRRPEPTRGGGT